MSDISDVRPETVIDERYRVISRIGSGGMADVYCAEDLQLGRKVALKVLYRRFAEDAEFVERFRREASSAAGLQHPNIVAVYDRGAWDATYYIAMEYLGGRSLKQMIREEGPLEPARAVDLAVQILRAARFAHKRGVIHRDIKPHNVIVDDEDRAKVTDFGIARAGASDMTETGSIMGTAQYLSPEQAQGHPVSARSDLYSIGIVLYEMLTGRVPFDAESAVTIALKQVSEEPVPPRALNPAVSPELEDVVLIALQKDPAARFADADEFMSALEAVRDLPPGEDARQRTGPLTGVYPALEPYPMPDGPYDPADAEEGRRGVRRGLIALLVVLALAGAGLAAYLLLQPKETEVPNVVGKSSGTAIGILQNAGFDARPQSVRSPDQPRDRVISQNPQPGEEAEEGSTVTIVVSSGPGEATIPAVRGQPLSIAMQRLRRAGFVPRVRREFSDTVRTNRVIETQPEELTQQERGGTVLLIVSRGPERVEVPDVRSLDRDAATRRLDDAGLEVSVREEESDEEDPGEVLNQDPAPGTRRAQGSTVTLTVAKEPSEVEVPDVVDLPRDRAVADLTEAGFRTRTVRRTVDTPDEDDIVLEQNPPAGARRNKDTRITLTVGRFDPGTLDPDPTASPSPTTAP